MEELDEEDLSLIEENLGIRLQRVRIEACSQRFSFSVNLLVKLNYSPKIEQMYDSFINNGIGDF